MARRRRRLLIREDFDGPSENLCSACVSRWSIESPGGLRVFMVAWIFKVARLRMVAWIFVVAGRFVVARIFMVARTSMVMSYDTATPELTTERSGVTYCRAPLCFAEEVQLSVSECVGRLCLLQDWAIDCRLFFRPPRGVQHHALLRLASAADIICEINPMPLLDIHSSDKVAPDDLFVADSDLGHVMWCRAALAHRNSFPAGDVVVKDSVTSTGQSGRYSIFFQWISDALCIGFTKSYDLMLQLAELVGFMDKYRRWHFSWSHRDSMLHLRLQVEH